MPQNKLYVGNMSFQSSQADLQDAFAAYGTVVSVDVIMDRETGRPRGFAFVQMSTDAEAQAAMQGLNGTDLGGRSLKVNVAKAREGGSVGGGRSDGGRGERW